MIHWFMTQALEKGILETLCLEKNMVTKTIFLKPVKDFVWEDDA